MPSKEQQLYLPQTDPEVFEIESTLVDFSEIIKDHFGETSMMMMYGSAAFKQVGYSQEDIDASKLDCIIAVPDIKKWQQEHSSHHPEDFPITAHLLGSNIRSGLQGEKAWFIHTQLPINDGKNQRKIKVGIIGHSALVKDLTEWTQLYIAGRMQKQTYMAESTPEINHALYYQTMKQGLHLALLQYKGQHINLRDLYIDISSLSYKGSFRDKFKAEDPNKVANIVDANLWRIDLMYKQLIKDAQQNGLLLIQGDTIIPISWEDDKDLFIKTVEELPTNIVINLPLNWRELPILETTTIITKILEKIVFASSFKQLILSSLMVNPMAGLQYAARKLKKGRQSK